MTSLLLSGDCMTPTRIIRWGVILMVGVLIGAGTTYYAAANGDPIRDEPKTLRDCCRDLGYIQAAVVERINESKGERRPVLLVEALERTGLKCVWTDGAGTVFLECR